MSRIYSFDLKSRMQVACKRARDLSRNAQWEGILRILDGLNPAALPAPEMPCIWARALRETGQPQKALELLKNADVLHMDHLDTLWLAMDVHDDLRNYDYLLRIMDRYLSLEPATPLTIQRLLSVYRQLGMWERAFEAAKFVLQSKIHSTEQSQELAELAIRAGMKDEIHLIRQRVEQTHGPKAPLVQRLKRAEACHRPRRVRSILLRQSGAFVLGSLGDDGLTPPFFGKDTGLQLPDGAQRFRISLQEIRECLRRLKLLFNLSSLPLPPVYIQSPRLQSFAKQDLIEMGFEVLNTPSSECMRMILEPGEYHPESPKEGLHFCVAAPSSLPFLPQPVLIGGLLPENAVVSEVFEGNEPGTSTLSRAGLHHLLEHLRYSGINPPVQRMGVPSSSALEAQNEVLNEVHGHIDSLGNVALEQTSNPESILGQLTPKAGLQLYSLARIWPGRLGDWVMQHGFNALKTLSPQAQNLLFQSPTEKLLNWIDELYSQQQVPVAELFEVGAARILFHLHPKAARKSLKIALKRSNANRLLRIFQSFGHHPHPWIQESLVQVFKNPGERNLQPLLQWSLEQGYSFPANLLLRLQAHCQLDSIGWGLLREKHAEPPRDFLLQLDPSLRARILMQFELQQAQTSEVERYLQGTPLNQTALPWLRGCLQNKLLRKLRSSLHQCQDETERLQLHSILLQNHESSGIETIFHSPQLKSSLTESLIASLQDWIIQLDSHHDTLFLMQTPYLHSRCTLASGLLQSGNFEGWLMLKRLFSTYAGLIGTTILEAMLLFRADKALETFFELGVQQGYLPKESCCDFALLLASKPEWIDEFHTLSGLPQHSNGADAFYTLLRQELFDRPQIMTAFCLLFPRQNPEDWIRTRVRETPFSEPLYQHLKSVLPKTSQTWLAESRLNTPLARMIDAEERGESPWVLN